MLYKGYHEYDRQLLARFASRVKLCPIGSLVRLNNEELAVVIKESFKNPHHPSIKLISRDFGVSNETEVIDLSKCSDSLLQINGIAQPTEVLLPYTDLLAAFYKYLPVFIFDSLAILYRLQHKFCINIADGSSKLK